MQINIENPDYPDCVDEAALISVVQQLAGMAQRDSGCVVPWCEVNVYLLDDDSIDPVHVAVQGIAGSTDVITQRYEAIPGEPEGLAGEIFVNLQCACHEGERSQESGVRSQESGVRSQGAGGRNQEEENQWSIDKELALYIAHGCDHLTDAEDESEEGFQAMRQRELAWLDELRLTALVIKPIINRN